MVCEEVLLRKLVLDKGDCLGGRVDSYTFTEMASSRAVVVTDLEKSLCVDMFDLNCKSVYTIRDFVDISPVGIGSVNVLE